MSSPRLTLKQRFNTQSSNIIKNKQNKNNDDIFYSSQHNLFESTIKRNLQIYKQSQKPNKEHLSLKEDNKNLVSETSKYDLAEIKKLIHKELEPHNQKLNQLASKINSLSLSISEKEEPITMNNNLIKQIDTLIQTKFQVLENQIEQMRYKFNNDILKLKTNIKSMSRQLDECEEHMENLIISNSTFEEGIEVLKTNVKKIDNKFKLYTLNKKFDLLEKEIKEYKCMSTNDNKNNNENKEIKKMIQQEMDDLNFIKNEYKEFVDKALNFEQMQKQLDNLVEKVKDTINELKIELEEYIDIKINDIVNEKQNYEIDTNELVD